MKEADYFDTLRGPGRKRRSAMAIPVIAGMVVLLATDAIAQNIRMRADIPFGFHVQDKAFDAGSYWIQVRRQPLAGGFSRQLEIVSPSPKSDVDEQFNLAVGAVYRPENEVRNGTLVFDNFGGVYALRNIWVAHEAAGYIVLISKKTEHELARKVAQRNSIDIALR